MKTELFIVNKLLIGSKGSFSGFIIRIAIGAIALSMATMIITGSFVNGFQREIRSKIFGFWAHLHIMPYSLSRSMEDQGTYKYQDFYRNRLDIPGVQNIHCSALKGGLLKAGDSFEGVVLKGLDEDFDTSLLKPYLCSGHFFSFDTSKLRKGIILSTYTARKLNLKPGDNVNIRFPGTEIRTRPFKISGLYETGLEEVDNRYVLTDLSAIQELNAWGKDTIGFFEVMLSGKDLFKSRFDAYAIKLFGPFLSEESYRKLAADPIDQSAEEVSKWIENPELDVQTIKNSFPGIFEWLELQDMNELIILSLMLLVACMNMMTCLLILIMERSHMIGLLKALGADSFSIGKLFLLMSSIIIVLGLLLGNVAGIGLCILQESTQILKLPKESYYLDAAPVSINWLWIGGLNIFILIFCTLFMILPSWLISRIHPVTVLKAD